VEVHRGLPSSGRDPVGFAATRRQAQAWIAGNPEVVIPRLRPLRYDEDVDGHQVPREKGVDVNLAIGIVEQIMRGACDVAILLSHDTDLLPLVETVARLKGPRAIETTSWRSDDFRQRLRTKVRGVHHHDISAAGGSPQILLEHENQSIQRISQ
jgi:NYN domain